jgi:hypothetical protein
LHSHDTWSIVTSAAVPEESMMLARAGWALLVGAGLAFLYAFGMAAAGQGVGIGLRGPGGVIVGALFTLLALGTAFLALAGSSPVLRDRALRVALWIFSVGAFLEAVAAITSITIDNDGLGSLPLLIAMFGGLAGMLLGLAALAISVPAARHRS